MGTEKKYVLVMRGLIREQRHWGAHQEMLEAALPGCEVVGLDIPGNGKLNDSKSLTQVIENVHYLRAQWKDRVPEDARCGIIALSLGGMIATAWLQEYPEDFHRAILINTSFSGLSPFYHRMQVPAFLKILPSRFSASPRVREEAVFDIVSNSPHKKEDLLSLWVKLAEDAPVKKRNAARQLLAGLRYRPNLIDKPRIPILVLAGKGDRLCSYRCSEAIAAHWFLPIRLHETGGHELHHDDPNWTFGQIGEWFAEL
jgi:pimeloyl-ACP methyl ester carboxylesterase